MNYSFIIRKAELADAPAVWNVLQDSFREYLEFTGSSRPPDALNETVQDIERDIETAAVFVAFIDDMPVGTVRVKIISRFGVKTAYHNIGIGKALMNLVDKVLVSRGVSSVSLHTAAKHRDLIRFYYGRGFYVHSTNCDRGYIRALMIKEYGG